MRRVWRCEDDWSGRGEGKEGEEGEVGKEGGREGDKRIQTLSNIGVKLPSNTLCCLLCFAP